MDVYEKLHEVQQKLEAPKNQYNSFGKYNYRSNEDILNALKPILSAVNAVVVQSDDVVSIGSRNYIKATSTFICVETKETVSNTAIARESETKKGMDDAQITGSTSSYARKYSLNGLFAIDDTKDPDTQKPPNGDTKKPPTGAQQQNNDKPWLNEKDRDGNTLETYKQVETAIKSGKMTVNQLFNSFKISKLLQEKLRKLEPNNNVPDPGPDPDTGLPF